MQLVGDDLARRWLGTQHALEEAFGRRRVSPFLQQDVELCAMLVNRAPAQPRLAAQAELDAVIPAYGAADDYRREPVSEVE